LGTSYTVEKEEERESKIGDLSLSSPFSDKRKEKKKKKKKKKEKKHGGSPFFLFGKERRGVEQTRVGHFPHLNFTRPRKTIGKEIDQRVHSIPLPKEKRKGEEEGRVFPLGS